MNKKLRLVTRALLVALVSLLARPQARADAVTGWNVRAGEIVTEAKINAAAANRVMAIVHAALYEATNAITRRYRSRLALEAARGASVDAAIAAASRVTLLAPLPAQRTSIEAAYQEALGKVPDGAPRADGIAAGEKAAAAILAMRQDDGAATGETYRSQAIPGAYVPTAVPVASQWPQRRPWLMEKPDQFRPGPPPSLDSEVWARDFMEVREMGARNSTRRSPEQTEIARFWEATLPPIYHGLVRSIASDPGREVTRNARLFAAVTQASDDALIAVFDAKYQYRFWRPITAIRNGDLDGNAATERDPSWMPLIDTPLHPEYPCAHCIVASAVGTVLRAELGDVPVPRLTTTSPTSGCASRSWAQIDDFVREVSEARIRDGVHYRNSTEVGVAMGKQVGELAVAKVLRTRESATPASGDGRRTGCAGAWERRPGAPSLPLLTPARGRAAGRRPRPAGAPARGAA
jgi:hypothetical protein